MGRVWHRWLLFVGLVLLVTGAGITSAQGAARPKLQHVSLLLDFYPSPQYSAIAWGEAQGVFAKYGISLSTVASDGSGVSVPEVNEGKVPFAFGGYDYFIQAALKGEQGATPIEVYENIPTTGIISAKPITSLHQLVGKTFGDVAGSSGIPLLKYVLQKNGIAPSSVKIDLFNFSVLYSEFYQHKIFAAEMDEPGDESALVQAKAAGVSAAYTPLSKFGLTGYSDVLYASDNEIKTHPTLVKDFATALYESEVDSIAHATNAQIVKDTQKLVPTDTAAEILPTWNDFKSQITGYGRFNPTVVSGILKRDEAELHITTTNVTVNKLYTNAYLPAA